MGKAKIHDDIDMHLPLKPEEDKKCRELFF